MRRLKREQQNYELARPRPESRHRPYQKAIASCYFGVEHFSRLGETQHDHDQKNSNRQNTRKSTGPREADAKSRSSQNALKHGLFACNPVLPDEDADAYADNCTRLLQELHPVGYFEELLFDQIADLLWRLRRVKGVASMTPLPTDGRRSIRRLGYAKDFGHLLTCNTKSY